MPPISVEEALAIVLRAAPLLPPEEVPASAALGRILAEEVRADQDFPSFDKSLMDGYAVVAADLTTPARRLEVQETIHAGRSPESLRPVGPGRAARIMTGAPLPPGADTVLPVEESEAADGGGAMIARAALRPGANVARRGDDGRSGDRFLEAGELIGPAEMAVLAACGRTRVRAGGRPRVALLVTGDELVEPERRPPAGKIRNSNGPLLAAFVRRLGLEPLDLGVAADDPARLRETLKAGLASDVLITSGGVSMGERDLVAETLRALGVTIHFDRVAIRPGKPFTFGTRETTLVFACPGNPVSTYVIAQLFARPALRRMMGYRDPSPAPIRGRLDADVSQRPGRAGYHQARAVWEADHYRVTILPSSGSADFVSCARANALAVVPAGADSLPAGGAIDLILLDDAADR